MAEARLRFGTKSSADVKLFLTRPGEEKYARNPVYLHSQILKRFKYFEGKFCDRWEPYKSTEIRVTTTHNFDHYLKCIEIMYGERVDFPSIEECLGILSVASEMVAEESIIKCTQYLEAVSWSAEEESQIRKVLSSEGLKLKISQDLAARLHQDYDDDHINFVEKIIQEIVSLIIYNSDYLYKNRETAEKDLRGMLEPGNTCRDVVDVCGRVLLQEFKASVDSRSFLTLKLVFNLIQHCDGGILEAAREAFCENAELIEYVKDYARSKLSNIAVVFDIIMWFMKAAGDGKIIIPRASRVSFLTTWLPIMGKFRCYISPIVKFEEFDKAVLKMVESLPRVDQKRICVLWAEVYRKENIDIATPLTLYKFLLV